MSAAGERDSHFWFRFWTRFLSAVAELTSCTVSLMDRPPFGGTFFDGPGVTFSLFSRDRDRKW